MNAVGVNRTVFDHEVVHRVMGPRLVRTFDVYRDVTFAEREAAAAGVRWPARDRHRR